MESVEAASAAGAAAVSVLDETVGATTGATAGAAGSEDALAAGCSDVTDCAVSVCVLDAVCAWVFCASGAESSINGFFEAQPPRPAANNRQNAVASRGVRLE
jgi:hypothetical protein